MRFFVLTTVLVPLVGIAVTTPASARPTAKPMAPRGAVYSGLEQRVNQWQKAMPRYRSRDTIKRRTVRAAAFNKVLGQLNRPKLSQAKRTAATSALLKFARAEPNPALKKYAVGALLKHGKALPKGQRRQLPSLKRQAFPVKPVIPKKGPVEVRHFVGDEFFKGEVAGYRREGFKVTSDGYSATATRGRLRVKVYKGDSQIFRHMGDKNVNAVIYSGHSDIGGINELSLRGAPKQKGDKLLVLLQCAGQQTMPLVGSRYSRAHLLTTKSSSYASADWNIIRSLMNGLERGGSYKDMRRDARSRQGIKNYIYPDSLRSSKHWDMDRDGRADFSRNKARPADGRFNVADGRSKAPAHKLMSAVRFLNSRLHYYAADTPNARLTTGQAEGRLYSGGIASQSRYAKGKHARQVTQITTRKAGGRKVYEVKLDPRFKRAPKPLVAAASIYEMNNHLTAGTRRGKVPEKDQLRGLLFASDYLYRLTPSYSQSDKALGKLMRMKKLPKVGFGEMQRVLRMGKHLGNDTQLAALKGLLDQRRATPR